jgi:hypothetical protein
MFISTKYDNQYGIIDAYVSEDRSLTNQYQEKNYFLQISVECYDYSSGFSQIDNIEIKTYLVSSDNNTLTSYSLWNSLRRMKGEFTFGGSAFLKGEDFDPGENELLIEITMHMELGFNQVDEISYSLTYILEVTI